MISAIGIVFEKRVMEAYYETIRIGYTPTVFLDMVEKSDVVTVTKQLISSPNLQYGFEKLWELNRLDLSLEAIILEEPFKDLFSEALREKARLRLSRCGYHTHDTNTEGSVFSAKKAAKHAKRRGRRGYGKSY